MAKSLVIVESPAKAKTINKYLGRDYIVIASMGHVRDLPKSKLGVDVDDGFTPVYEPLASRKKVLAELKAAAKDATDIYIATDPDREGEAIGWHLAEELGTKKKKIHRLMFNEITKKAVQEAMKHPGTIDLKMVDAQQARRVLDRLVGYKISPILWDKVRRGLSAGRVQSVALKLICDREKEISKFVPEEYWHLFATLAGPQPPEFEAKLVKKGDETIKVGNEEESKKVLRDLEGAAFTVTSVATKERKRNAAPPFITSKLQQTARYPGEADDADRPAALRRHRAAGIGRRRAGRPHYLYAHRLDPRVRRCAGGASRAHRDGVRRGIRAREAERLQNEGRCAGRARGHPSHVDGVRPGKGAAVPQRRAVFALSPDLEPLRRLADAARHLRRNHRGHSGGRLSVPRQGHGAEIPGLARGLRPAEEKPETEKDKDDDDSPSGVLPPLAEGDRLELKALRPEQKFTQPPPRFTEATLVKELEENGIGRPSTYASIIGVLQDRDYTNKVEGRFKPTALGMIITDLLIKSFVDILDVEYTRGLEEDLDRIEQGKADYKGTLTTFYKKFKKDLAKAGKEMQNLKEGIKTEEICDRCGKPMVIKVGKFGPFVACSGYPDCTNTRELEKSDPGETVEAEEEVCENCGKPMVVKRGRFGQFLACTGYPECKTTRKLITTGGGLKAAKPDQILDEKCPRCDSNLVIKQGPLRRIHGVHEVSRVQVREAQEHRREVPEQRRRRHRRAQVAPRQGVLRLQQLSRLRVHALEAPGRRSVPRPAARRSCSRRSRRRPAGSSSAARKIAATCATRRWKSRNRNRRVRAAGSSRLGRAWSPA